MKKKILAIKVAGGMGNRMLCTACGLIIGKALSRDVFIDWWDTAYGDGTYNSFYKFFEHPDSLNQLPLSNSLYPEIWRGHLKKSVSEMLHKFYPNKHSSPTIHKKLSINPKTAELDKDILVFWYYTERFSHFKNLIKENLNEYSVLKLEEMRKKSLKSIVLKSEIRNHINQFVETNFNGKILGIHVRYSDLKSDLNKILQLTNKIYFTGNYQVTFISTDNQFVLDLFKKSFPVVISTTKWYPNIGEAMHQNNKAPDRLQNGVEALIDMYLLANCDGLIYSSKSTFGTVAWLLSDIKKHNCHDIDKNNPILLGKKIIKWALA